MNVRLNRLRADYQKMQVLKAQSEMIDFQLLSPPLAPPDRYRVTFRCKGIERIEPYDPEHLERGEPVFREDHQVEVYLPDRPEPYPTFKPILIWRTPIWHPNIDHRSGAVCTNVWYAAKPLLDHVLMLYDMARYANYHDDPHREPFPLDLEVAAWCQNYRRRRPGCFPVDKRLPMLPDPIGGMREAPPPIPIEVRPADEDDLVNIIRLVVEEVKVDLNLLDVK